MIFLPELKSYMQTYVCLDENPLPHCLVGFLKIPYCDSENAAMIALINPRGDTQHIACAGFLLAGGENSWQPDFLKGMEWLRQRKLSDQDLLQWEETLLLGITLGVKTVARMELSQWWRELLKTRLSASTFVDVLLDFLRDQHAEDTEEWEELSLMLQLQQATEPEDFNQAYQYFLKFRRRPFPYYEGDYFKTILSIYILQRVLEQHPIFNLEQNFFEPVLKEISKVASRKASWVSWTVFSLGILIPLGILGMICLQTPFLQLWESHQWTIGALGSLSGVIAIWYRWIVTRKMWPPWLRRFSRIPLFSHALMKEKFMQRDAKRFGIKLNAYEEK